MIYRLFLLFLPFGLFAQSVSEEIFRLSALGEKIMMGADSVERHQANAQFKELLIETLESAEKPFDMDFSPVKNLSVQKSDDDKVVIFTWIVPDVPGKEKMNGLLMVRRGKKKKQDFHLHELDDLAAELSGAPYQMLSGGRWYGALYYQIFTVTHKRQTYYMLMGYRPISAQVQKKLIDVLHIASDGVPRFGAKIFNVRTLMDYKYERPPYRLFFQYSTSVSASFRYLPNEKIIVLDHLSPPENAPPGMWAMYGPDFSYDGLEFVKGVWELREEITFDSGIKQDFPSDPPKKDPRTGKVQRR